MKHSTRILFLLIPFLIISCQQKKKQKKKETREVTMATEFNNLVIVDSLGVTGSDGVISFPLSNGTSAFMMGDSFLKPVVNHKRDPKSTMINNTFIVVDKRTGVSKSIYQGTLDHPETMLVPENKNNMHEYYWPGHGFEYEGELHVFMSRFIHIPPIDNGWDFQYSGTDYLKLEKDTYKIILQEDFPFSNENGVHYGHSLLKEDDYTYIYGTKSDGKNSTLHVSRGKMNTDTNKLTAFEFFNGEKWVENAKETKPLKGIQQPTSEQFSVFKYGDKYVFVTQARSLTAGDIYSYISNSPTGPWSNEKHLYHTTEQDGDKENKIFTYNAMSHPQYIKDNKLLVSYCVNSFDVPKIHANTDFYRPRFIWVPMEHILE